MKNKVEITQCIALWAKNEKSKQLFKSNTQPLYTHSKLKDGNATQNINYTVCRCALGKKKKNYRKRDGADAGVYVALGLGANSHLTA